MTEDIVTREPADLVEAETRELVEPEPTELVERRTEELVERPTVALVERNWYECIVCGYRSGHGVHEQLCPLCGGMLKNIGVAQE
ncbi:MULTISPECIES: rubrerythrin-like domain-containing protein [Haloferax]|uniref:Rubrerythrin-like domain-containing protein n=1 Tax=Haloferax marinum TaxID=2666143 RepID=A0A6A8G8M8_9EURY|nr:MULTISPECIES: rubrerythrin-like domain-containing protein [Haloferax]KAB1197894.1 rubrerythrin-like domain-containing protein [Haloferax sp. CBA1150]MRW96958.1 rubrerythrin-like domain-containing protein [Haloferax marinum]